MTTKYLANLNANNNVPEKVFELTRLDHLRLRRNKLTANSDSIGNLKVLRVEKLIFCVLFTNIFQNS